MIATGKPNNVMFSAKKPSLKLFDTDNGVFGEWEFGIDKIYPAFEFGRGLVQTNDLDPMYVALYYSGLTPFRMKQWLLAYWCYNHPISASRIASDPKLFWKRMRQAVTDPSFPRGVYRRHFRGKQGNASLDYLQARGLISLFDELKQAEGKKAQDIRAIVQTWRGFGPTVSFKVADMCERLGIVVTTFDPNDSPELISDSPRKGALMLVGKVHSLSEDERLTEAMKILVEHFKGYKAPPRYERPIGLQEVETMMCKWKSHKLGRYEVGADLLEKQRWFKEGEPFTDFLMKGGKKGFLW